MDYTVAPQLRTRPRSKNIPFLPHWKQYLKDHLPADDNHKVCQPHSDEDFLCAIYEDNSKLYGDEKKERNLVLVQNMEHTRKPWNITETVLYKELKDMDPEFDGSHTRVSFGILVAGDEFMIFKATGNDDPLPIVGTGEKPLNKKDEMYKGLLDWSLTYIIRNTSKSEFKYYYHRPRELSGESDNMHISSNPSATFQQIQPRSAYSPPSRTTSILLQSNTLQLEGITQSLSGMSVQSGSTPLTRVSHIQSPPVLGNALGGQTSSHDPSIRGSNGDVSAPTASNIQYLPVGALHTSPPSASIHAGPRHPSRTSSRQGSTGERLSSRASNPQGVTFSPLVPRASESGIEIPTKGTVNETPFAHMADPQVRTVRTWLSDVKNHLEYTS